MRRLLVALTMVLAGCSMQRGIPVPFDTGGHVVICSTLPGGRGYHYATDEAGGCPYPLVNPWRQDRAAWCRWEPVQVTRGDPGCSPSH